jgi:hypothetical protein
VTRADGVCSLDGRSVRQWFAKGKCQQVDLALPKQRANIGDAGIDDSLRIGQMREKGKKFDWVFIGYGPVVRY